MNVTKRDIRIGSHILIDQNGNVNIHNALIRGDLRVHGKVYSVAPDQTVSVATVSAQYYCDEWTMDMDGRIGDNEPFEWIHQSSVNQTVRAVTLPHSGLYTINVRIYDASDSDESSGSGVSLYINDVLTYFSACGTRAVRVPTIRICYQLRVCFVPAMCYRCIVF